MAFYGTLATGAGWIVPKKYVEKVGDDGFKKHPIGLGPYKFVSHPPGVELVMEAFEGYWRKMPSVKRLVFKVVPEPTTRAAMLKRGEVDVAYMLDAPQASELQKDPTLRLAFSGGIGIATMDFLDMWDPKSPWADRRVRLAANYAIDRRTISEMETLGASKPTGSIIPRTFEFALPIEPYPYDPAKAKQLLAEAGYPNGFDGRRAARDAAVLLAGRGGHELSGGPGHQAPDAPDGARGLLLGVGGRRSSKASASAAAGSTATPPRGCRRSCPSDGTYAYGGYPDIDALYKQQALETDRKKREAMLHQIQQTLHERVRFAPIFEFLWPSGIGPAGGRARAAC